MKTTALPKLVPLLAMVAALVAFAACGDDDDTAATPATGAGATETPAAASPTTAATATTTTGSEDGPTVRIGDNFFDPESLTIKAGETVRWVWSGSVPHSVRLEDETSPTHTGSGEFEFTFTEPGTYDYVCGVHGSSMPGTIIVE